MSQRTYTNVLEIRLGGSPIPERLARLLLSAWVDSSMNLPSAFELTFSDPNSEAVRAFPQLAVGAKVELVPIGDGRSADPLLTGEVTALEIAADRTGRTLRVRGYDPAHRLLRNRRVAGYPNMTAGDIVRKLARMCSVKLGRVDPTRTVYELATQPNITDWDFLTRLALENDVYLYVDRTGALQFTARRGASGAPAESTPAIQSPYVLEFGTNMLSCRAGVTSAGQVDTVTVRGWDVRTKRPLTADAPATSSAASLIDVTPKDVARKFGRAELVESELPYSTQAQVQQAATALAEDVTGAFAELEVSVTGTPELGPGVPVALNGAGAPFEGRYTVTSARHVFATGQQYTTWVEVTGRQVRSLYGLASGAAATTPVLSGVANALVSNVKDPTKRGRVKLRFPWLSDTYESDWCRVAQFGGVRGGGLNLPEVGDEVLVAFDRGSLEHPYVLAGLYNGLDEATPDPDRVDPVDPVSGRVNWRSMASRSGHTIQLLDARTRSTSGIRLRTGNGALTVHLDQSKTAVTIRSDGTVTIQGGRNVDVRAGGDLNLSAGRAVNITGGGAVNIKATGALGLDTTGAMSISAAGAATVKSLAPLTLTSTISTSIQSPAVTVTGVLLSNGRPV
jgi:phage protein D